MPYCRDSPTRVSTSTRSPAPAQTRSADGVPYVSTVGRPRVPVTNAPPAVALHHSCCATVKRIRLTKGEGESLGECLKVLNEVVAKCVYKQLGPFQTLFLENLNEPKTSR